MMTDVALLTGAAVAVVDDEPEDDRLGVLSQIVDQHAAQRRSLIEYVMRVLFGLWGWNDSMNDPVLRRAAVAATIMFVDEAMEAARVQERAYVQAYAQEMGVTFTPAELRTEPIYPRNADMVEVYERVIDEYRWQRYGRVNAGRSEGVPDTDEAVVDAGEAGADGAVGVDPVSRPVRPAGGSSLADDIDDLAAIFDDGDASTTTFDPEQWAELEALERQAEESLLAQGEEAFQRALARLEKIVSDDVNLAGADEHRQLLGKKRMFLGYRRVIHPELSETGTCGLCVAASTRLYRKKALLPMHTDCKCTVMGVTVDADPAREMNVQDATTIFEAGLLHEYDFTLEDLQEAYELAAEQDVSVNVPERRAGESDESFKKRLEAAARAMPNMNGTAAAQLKAIRFEFYEHGELGPRLSAGRGRQDKPFVEQTFADSRAMWSRTIEWAQERRSEAVQARDAAKGADREVYGAVVENYTSLISRLTGKLNRKHL